MRRFLIIVFLIFPFIAEADTTAADNMTRKHNEVMRKRSRSHKEIERVAKEFEAVAVTKMLQSMYEGVKMDPIFNSNSTEEIYKELLLQEYANIVTESGGIGIKDSIVREMKNMNEGRK